MDLSHFVAEMIVGKLTFIFIKIWGIWGNMQIIDIEAIELTLTAMKQKDSLKS